jgi:hypothetical protein
LISTEIEWRDLLTKGYVVIRSFLAEPARAVLEEDFRQGPPPATYPHGFKLIGRRALEKTWQELEPALREVRAATSLKVDLLTFLTFSHYIVTERTERTSHWHQDFDYDYQLTGDHTNYLNFYVPIRKPDVTRSNVSVIPFDALRSRSPQAAGLLEGGGGRRLIAQGGKTSVYGHYGDVLEEDAGEEPAFTLELDIDELAATPALASGDLLLMRGDVIHRTQDADTERMAASIRVTHSQKRIRRDRIARDDRGQATGGGPMARLDAAVIRSLDALDRTEITIEEFLRHAGGAA